MDIDQEKYSEWKKFVDNEFRRILKQTNYSTLDFSILLGKILYVIVGEMEISPEEIEEMMHTPDEKCSRLIRDIIYRIILIFEEVRELEPDYKND